jgi:rhodanese-related sulfurtransferase
MPTSVKSMMDEAHAVVPRISIDEAKALISKGALVVDVRDAPEVEKSGKISGACHISRGKLEFRADIAWPYDDKAFDKSTPVIVYCASGG